jgi:hypothetical protein
MAQQPQLAPVVGMDGVQISTGPAQEYTFDHTPKAHELDQVPFDAKIMTPYGQMTRDPNTGQRRLQLDERGKQKWTQTQQQARRAYGFNPMSRFPGAPVQKLVFGKPNFNPFTGDFSRVDDPFS